MASSAYFAMATFKLLKQSCPREQSVRAPIRLGMRGNNVQICNLKRAICRSNDLRVLTLTNEELNSLPNFVS